METKEGSPTERVSAADIEREVTGAKGGEVTPIQRAGIQILLGVGVAIVIFTVLIGLVNLSNLPPPPPTPSGSSTGSDDLARYKELVGFHDQIWKAAFERATQMFQLVVATTLLPVFTTVLGYIFGSRRASE